MSSKKPRNKTNKWSGPVARTLHEVYGSGRSLTALFNDKVDQIRSKLDVAGPPFDPFEYAKALGIRVLEEEDLVADGILRRLGGQFEVRLRKQQSETRKSFTLAHEIAHTFFYADLEEFGEKYRGSSSYDAEEERLCNLAAAELLMPRKLYLADLNSLSNHDPTCPGSRVISPNTILKLMSKYKVSLRAAAIRASAVLPGLIVAMWSIDSGPIRTNWVAPYSAVSLGLCVATVSSVRRAEFGCPGLSIQRDSFYLSGRLICRKTASLSYGRGAVISVLQPLRKMTGQMSLWDA
jgi:Zn-dependent peptidase ImmA (M78 family)